MAIRFFIGGSKSYSALRLCQFLAFISKSSSLHGMLTFMLVKVILSENKWGRVGEYLQMIGNIWHSSSQRAESIRYARFLTFSASANYCAVAEILDMISQGHIEAYGWEYLNIQAWLTYWMQGIAGCVAGCAAHNLCSCVNLNGLISRRSVSYSYNYHSSRLSQAE